VCAIIITIFFVYDLLSDSVYWKHPMLLHSKEPISRPLTTLPSEDLQEKAAEIFKVDYDVKDCIINLSLSVFSNVSFSKSTSK